MTCHLDFSFDSKLLQPVVQFACFPGHYASVKTPDLHHQRCHLYRSHLDLGYLLLTPTCYLPEIIYLQVQVRLTAWGLRGLRQRGACLSQSLPFTFSAFSHLSFLPTLAPSLFPVLLVFKAKAVLISYYHREHILPQTEL